MKFLDYVQLFAFVLLLTLLTKPFGAFMAQVFQQEKNFLSRVLGWLEILIYKVGGINPKTEMHWKDYAKALMAFSLFGIFFVFVIQLIQQYLPLNPQNMPAISWHSAINTAVSFVTNTNWQGYSGETTMSYLTQMLALTVQNFMSAAVGLAVAIALIRGITNRSQNTIGNFWSDLTKSLVYILIPLSTVFALILISQGVVQTFSPYITATTVEGAKQTIPLGPAASQISIKMLGTNGGGFFNANSLHPFENPTGLSNFLEMLSILVIPAGLTYTFGKMTKRQKHGWLIYIVMLVILVGFSALSLWSEYSTNPIFNMSALMEGKETRIGVFNSILFSSVTTSASCGAINAMHSSLSPLSGGIALLNMMLGEIIFGGVGSGLYGMMLFILLTVFIAGLMVGRTPEYLGKKIEARDMTLVILAIIIPCAVTLLSTAISIVLPSGLSSRSSQGPHGFSEILYAFTSSVANNGSAFAGLNANTVYYNLMLSVAMFLGRFGIILPILAVAGNLSAKKYSPPSPGTLEVDTFIFAILLIALILIVGALTFFPALSLGPIIEYFLMLQGRTF